MWENVLREGAVVDAAVKEGLVVEGGRHAYTCNR